MTRLGTGGGPKIVSLACKYCQNMRSNVRPNCSDENFDKQDQDPVLGQEQLLLIDQYCPVNE